MGGKGLCEPDVSSQEAEGMATRSSPPGFRDGSSVKIKHKRGVMHVYLRSPECLDHPSQQGVPQDSCVCLWEEAHRNLWPPGQLNRGLYCCSLSSLPRVVTFGIFSVRKRFPSMKLAWWHWCFHDASVYWTSRNLFFLSNLRRDKIMKLFQVSFWDIKEVPG